MVGSIGGELDVHNLGFEPSLIHTPATITPQLRWLSSMHNMIDLTEKAFLQENREHKKENEERNLKLQLYMMFTELIGGSSLDLRGLVNTGEQEGNRDLDSQQLILAIQVL